MEDHVFSVLYRILTERKEALSAHLVSGGAANYEKYCRACGQYSELEAIEDEIKALEKRVIDQ